MQTLDELTQSDVLVNLGVVIWRADRTDPGALAVIGTAIKLNHNSFVGHYNQGLILETYGQTENLRKANLSKALISYQRANCIYPQQPQVLIGMGRVLEKQEKLQAALNLTETVLSIHPQYEPALSLLQSLLTKMEDQGLPNSRPTADQFVQILNHCPPDEPQ